MEFEEVWLRNQLHFEAKEFNFLADYVHEYTKNCEDVGKVLRTLAKEAAKLAQDYNLDVKVLRFEQEILTHARIAFENLIVTGLLCGEEEHG